MVFPDGRTHLEKWRDATAKVAKLLGRILTDGCGKITHVVEERLGGFTGGMTTRQTLMALAAMNAVVSHHISMYGEIMYLAPVTTKRIMGLKDLTLPGEDKKDTVVRLARSSCPSFPYAETKAGNWKKGVDDMADAWLLAEAGLRVLRGEAQIQSGKQTTKDKRVRVRTRRPKNQ